MKKKLVVLTGAGISAESGLSTFRDSDGLWENHRVEDICTPEGWHRNPKMVLEFYNNLRNGLKNAKPNRAHELLAELEQEFDIEIITQNVDDLHERAKSSKIVHLHGELTKACDEYKIQVEDIGYQPIEIGQTINRTQARPFIVWFNEAVPEIETAIKLVQKADIFLIIGTSLNVYPAAGLINYVPNSTPIYLIDPKPATTYRDVTIISKGASEGMVEFVKLIQTKK